MTPDCDEDAGSPEGRAQYANKVELMLSMVGYAVGFGNIWRFPYLVYTYGGGAFLVPYVLALLLLGLPLFILELGLGQMYRRGTLGIWDRMGMPRFRGVGAAATLCTWLICLYYNVIIAWTLYFLGRTIGAAVSSGRLPWSDMGEGRGRQCPESVLIVPKALASSPWLIDGSTGLFNVSHAADFWCPESGIPKSAAEAPEGFASITSRPVYCPGASAVHFWHHQALQQSSGMDDLSGIHWDLWIAYTVAWVLIYFSVVQGIRTSGKVVYVTATLPYVALVAFFVRAITLPNADTGVHYFVAPNFANLLNYEVWIRAVSQIFYSLGVGFGSLIAFASYGNRHSNFQSDALQVSLINCGTSIFAGFVVFPVLGYLAHELSSINPCIQSTNLNDLKSIGLEGTGLAFIAFPIAISMMPGGFFWAMLFFVMLFCLGVDSQFAMLESVITVLADAGVGSKWPRPVLSLLVCLICYAIGLVFVTRGGIYWFLLFDYYSAVVALFFVTGFECVGLMWCKRSTWPSFVDRVRDWTGTRLCVLHKVLWKFVCPLLVALMVGVAVTKWDLVDAGHSKRFPEGSGYLPSWSVWIGWLLGILPVLLGACFFVCPGRCSGSSADLAAGREPRADESQVEGETSELPRQDAPKAATVGRNEPEGAA